MSRPAVVIFAVLAVAAPATAATHKILVLPLDGTADAATRTKLSAQVARLAKALDGQIATGDATFADAALAVGCDPQSPACSDEVMRTLGVDELIWGTATKDGSRIRLVVRRAAQGDAPRELAATVTADDAPDRIDARLAPLFSPPAVPDPTSVQPSSPATSEPAPPPATDGPATPPGAPGGRDDQSDRTLGIALTAGGGLSFVLGIALWASYASLQDSINRHPTRNVSDFQDLRSLEDRAGSYAIAGDIFVVAGVAAGSVGAYFLYRSHQHRVAITPAPIAHGAGLTLTLLGGL